MTMTMTVIDWVMTVVDLLLVGYKTKELHST